MCFAYAVYRDGELILCNPLFRAHAEAWAGEMRLPEGRVTQSEILPGSYAVRHAFEIAGRRYSLFTFLVSEGVVESELLNEMQHAVHDMFFDILSYADPARHRASEYAVKSLLERLLEIAAEKFCVDLPLAWADPLLRPDAVARFVWDGLILAFCMLLPTRVVTGRSHASLEMCGEERLRMTFHFGYGIEDSFRPALAGAIGRACGFAVTALPDGLIIELPLCRPGLQVLQAVSPARDPSLLALATALESSIACARGTRAQGTF